MIIKDTLKEIRKRRGSFNKHSESVRKNMELAKKRQADNYENFLKMKKENDAIFSRYQNK